MNETDWSQVDDAHGPAQMIPELVSRTRSGGVDGRAALRGLSDRLNHLGTISPAAEPALPLLLRAGLDPDHPRQAEVLALCLELASGGRFLQFALDPRGTTALLGPLHEMREALLEGSRRRDGAVRTHCIALLSLLPGDDVRARLREVTDQEERSVPLGMALVGLAIAMHRDGGDDHDGRRIQQGLESTGSLQVLAAFARVVADPDLDRAVVDVLLRAIGRDQQVSGLPLAGGRLGAVAARILARVAAAREDLALLERVYAAAAGQRMGTEVGLAVVSVVFRDRVDRIRVPSALSALQRWPLERFVTLPPIAFLRRERLLVLMERAGIPVEDLPRYLGMMSGPADTPVDGRPAWYWVRMALDGVEPPDRMVEQLSQLPQEQLTEVLSDLCQAPYGLDHRWPRPTRRSRAQRMEDHTRFAALLTSWAVAALSQGQLAQLLDEQRFQTNPDPRTIAVSLGAMLQKTGDMAPEYDSLLIVSMTEDLLVPTVRPLLAQLPQTRIEGLLLASDLSCRGGRPAVWDYLGLCRTRPIAEQLVDEMASWSPHADNPKDEALRLLRSREAREVLRDTLEEWPEHPCADDFLGVLKS